MNALMDAYADQAIACLLVSLRIGPTLAFAPPFTLLRVPALIRVLLSLGLAAWIVAGSPAPTPIRSDATLVAALASELIFGAMLAISLQLAFAALQTAGRTIDFQAGFGLALIADPTLRTQMPLIGALFSYAAGAIFFTTSAPVDLLAIWSRSLDHVPLGAFALGGDLSVLLNYITAVFLLAIGAGGLVMLTLFLVDLAIAALSRTLPQMNVLLLGFQAKTIALLAVLPFVFVLSGALFLRIVRMAVEITPMLP